MHKKIHREMGVRR